MISNSILIDRRKHSKILLMVLAGYKDALWEKVFMRLGKYINDEFDACIVSSGVYNDKLDNIAKAANWSYLYTSINNLCHAQNECIELHPNAKFIFKMDEDIFVTDGAFEKMLNCITASEITSGYIPSCVVPNINVNCVTYRRLLEKSNLLEEFKNKFTSAPITDGLHHNKWVLEDPEVAKFMWDNIDIDDVSLLEDSYSVCPVRFSIGLILFSRSTWEAWGKFPVELEAEVEYKRIGLGSDEKRICEWSMMKSHPIIITNDVLVGHLSYGPQTKEMMEYFKSNQDRF